jgi:ATP-binding cassette, subfamily G (WHITE), eye pigment precursor transporter
MDFQTKENELIWRNLNLKSTSPTNHLLTNINGSVGPSSMTALMGPSGAGKTTLLNALAGRLPANMSLTGEILLNSNPRNENDWPQIMGYVEQDFYAYDNQTVYETLNFCNIVKGSSDTQNIDDMMNILGLVKLKDSLVCKLSGGERKRLSIGVELLGNPPIIFLDEPTSGLDSFNAINILELLKKLTTFGKTILVTIHQPSYQQIKYFSRVILLSQGGMIYEGPFDECTEFFKDCGYNLPPNTNPTDFFLDAISLDTRSDESISRSMSKIDHIKRKWKSRETRHDPKMFDEIKPKKPRKKRAVFDVLLQRNITEYFRKRTYLRVKILQKIVLLLIFGLAYLRMGYSVNDVGSRKGSFNFLVLNNLFATCGPIFNVFPQEKRVIIRERRSGMYSGYSSFLSKFVSEIPFNMAYDMIYFIALYWIIGLNSSASRFFICCLIIASLILFSISFGLTISTISPSQNIAQIIGSTFVLLFVVYSGAFGSTATIPNWLRWLIYISPIYYAYTAILQNQFKDVFFYNKNGGKPIPGEYFIYQNDTQILEMWWCILLIWLYTLVWIIFGCFALQYVTRSNINLEKKERPEEV